MKEASGEANMTVITIVLIAIVLAVGTLIVQRIMRSTGQSAACQAAGGRWNSGRCCTDSGCGTIIPCSETGGEGTGQWECGL